METWSCFFCWAQLAYNLRQRQQQELAKQTSEPAMKQKFQHKGLDVYWFKTAKSLQTWLAKNVDKPESVWLMFAKKASDQRSVTYEEAREAALCQGWIDGLINSFSDAFCLRKFSHRRKKSNWSKINRDIAQGLIENGKMQPSGIAEVKAARRDGRWDSAYDSSATIEVPDDLAALLTAQPKTKERFEAASRSERYGFLYRLQTCKRDETRQRRLKQTAEHFASGSSLQAKKSVQRPIVILLRGVNVGTKNRIKMADVRRFLAGDALSDIDTLLQSGNIVCRTKLTPDSASTEVSKRLKKSLSIDIPVLSRSQTAWNRIVRNNPFASEDLSKVHVLLVDRRLTKTQLSTLEPYLRPTEKLSGSGQTLYFYLPNGASQTKLTSTLIEKKLNCVTTGRNWNTVMRLKRMLDEKA